MTTLTVFCKDKSRRICKLADEVQGKRINWNHQNLEQLGKDLEGDNYFSMSASFG